MKITLVTILFLIVLTSGAYILMGVNLQENKTPFRLEKMQVMRLNLKITIPPTMFPKKTVVELTPSLFGYQFKSFALQGVKAYGNAQTIDETAGATLIYSDYVPFESFMRDREGDGYLVITQRSKKGNVRQTSLTLKRNEDVYYYLDARQSTYFIMNMDYVFEEL